MEIDKRTYFGSRDKHQSLHKWVTLVSASCKINLEPVPKSDR